MLRFSDVFRDQSARSRPEVPVRCAQLLGELVLAAAPWETPGRRASGGQGTAHGISDKGAFASQPSGAVLGEPRRDVDESMHYLDAKAPWGRQVGVYYDSIRTRGNGAR